MYRIIILLFITLNVSANNYFCNEELGKMPLQQGGRVKPLSVHAKETIRHLTGKSKVNGNSPTLTYCLLSAKALGLPTKVELRTRVDHVETRKLLNVKSDISFKELLDKQRIIRTSMMRIKEDNGYKKELSKLLSKSSLYLNITSGLNWTLPKKSGNQIIWSPMSDYLTEAKVKSYSTNLNSGFAKVFAQARLDYVELKNDKFLVEYQYDKMQLMKIAMFLNLLALACLVLFKKFNLAVAISFMTVILQTAYLVMRVYISGRAPITNMYETVLFSGYGSLVLSLIIGHLKNEKIFVYMGLAYNFCCLLMLNFAGSMVNESISPLVPVLRDNFWLSTHVTTIILSYGALALSWILANTMMIKRKLSNLSSTDENYYNGVIYTTLKFGTVLLAAGIILGGVWADYSWGRFWGWDPKETWSLIVLCLYMAILHGKNTAWIPNTRFAHLVAAAFMSVMMAWFGVNYILASGLHSYGFSQGGAIFLGCFFLIQSLLLLVTLTRKEKI